MLKVVELGIMPYEQALAKQHEYHLKVRQSSDETEYLMVVQHPPVLTFGKHASAKNLLMDAASLRQKNIEVTRVRSRRTIVAPSLMEVEAGRPVLLRLRQW